MVGRPRPGRAIRRAAPTSRSGNYTGQENEAGAINVPIASGNNVALINTGDQRASAGTKQEQTNVNVTKQYADQSSGGENDTWSSDSKLPLVRA